MNVQTSMATYECQYGTVDRPVLRDDADTEAAFECCTHRFSYTFVRVDMELGWSTNQHMAPVSSPWSPIGRTVAEQDSFGVVAAFCTYIS